MNAVVDFPILTSLKSYSQLDLEFDAEIGTLFSWMNPSPRPCFNPTLLGEIQHAEKLIELHQGHFDDKGTPRRIEHIVFASAVQGVYNLGGDLGMFMQAIMRRDREMLTRYGELCVDNQYRRATGFGANICTIALLQGKALGGGFEAALACDVIIAERSTTLAFPEILFNLFPGMGALTFLSRRIGMRKAEQIVESGQVYSATEMHAMGVIDEVVDDGFGLEATRRTIQTRQRRQNAYKAIQRAKHVIQPLCVEELRTVVGIWVDAAMRLEARDLRMMARLVKAQDKLVENASIDPSIDAIYGDRIMLVAGAA